MRKRINPGHSAVKTPTLQGTAMKHSVHPEPKHGMLVAITCAQVDSDGEVIPFCKVALFRKGKGEYQLVLKTGATTITTRELSEVNEARALDQLVTEATECPKLEGSHKPGNKPAPAIDRLRTYCQVVLNRPQVTFVQVWAMDFV